MKCVGGKIKKDSVDLIPSPSVKIQIMGGKVCLSVKAKHCWALSTFLFSVQYQTDTKAKHGFLFTSFSFLSSLADFAKKFKFLFTPGSLQNSTKTFLNPLDFMY